MSSPLTAWARGGRPHLSAYLAGLSSACTRRPWCSTQGMCSCGEGGGTRLRGKGRVSVMTTEEAGKGGKVLEREGAHLAEGWRAEAGGRSGSAHVAKERHVSCIQVLGAVKRCDLPDVWAACS